jgi:5-(carboxyamino)imidazole ribonucleotide synthase
MSRWYGNNFRIGVLGGGQLGRMIIQDAVSYDIAVDCIDVDCSPCQNVAHQFVVGNIRNKEEVLAFATQRDLITVEIENVSIEALENLESTGKKVFPQPAVLKLIRDKGTQKQFFVEHNIPTSPFYLVDNKAQINAYLAEFPFMQKLRVGGYDGKGVYPLRNEAAIQKSFDAPSVLEKMVDFLKEISVIVARNERGETSVYPTVECAFNPDANLVEFLFSPAQISATVEEEAKKIAIQIISALNMVGILAVEMFLTKDHQLLVNEIAPRPHNSGHHTIECNKTSQFEQHLRAILNMPLGSTDIVRPGVMVNILGEQNYEGDVIYEGLDEILAMPGVYLHLYGKKTTKPFRKMGHVTITADTLEEAKNKAIFVKNTLKAKA